MMNINQVFITGRLTRNVILEFINKQPTATFGLSIDSNACESSIIEIVVKNSLAVRCNDKVSEGSKIFVEGKINQKIKTQILAKNIIFLN